MSESTSRRYSYIAVPKEIKSQWIARAESEGIATWVLLHKCFSYYYTASRKHFQFDSDKLAKAIWYIEKLAMSVGAFKTIANEKNYYQVLKNIEDIQDRLGIDLSDLRLAVDRYMRKRSKANKIAINESLRLAIGKLLLWASAKELNEST